MLVIGAKGHAKEVLLILEQRSDFNSDSICFFDDINLSEENTFFGRYKIIRSKDAAYAYLKEKPEFCIGVGGTVVRERLSKFFAQYATLKSIIAPSAILGTHQVNLGIGINVMAKCFISNSVSIGEGTLVNAGVNIHHDSRIGNYCEIGPGAVILGNVIIGESVLIGANATILPHVNICDGAIIGAGAVVTKDILAKGTYVGVPARFKK